MIPLTLSHLSGDSIKEARKKGRKTTDKLANNTLLQAETKNVDYDEDRLMKRRRKRFLQGPHTVFLNATSGENLQLAQ